MRLRRGRDACAVLVAAATLTAWVAATAPPAAGVTALDRDWHRGAIARPGGADAYGEPESDAALAALAETGSTHVNFYVEWFVDGPNSSTVGPHPRITPTDESLLHAMAVARSLGLRPTLTLVVRRRDGGWQAWIDPDDERAWFASYRRMTQHYADLARQGRAKMIVLGAELESMAEESRRWRSVIRVARRHFPGELTYSANAVLGAERIKFWRAFDYIGLSAYESLSSEASPSAKSLSRQWRERGYFARIKRLHKRYDRPVIFTELGYGSYDTSALNPWRSSGGQPSQEAQRRAYEGFYRAWANVRWFRGVYWWFWGREVYPDGTSHSPRGKAAERTMRRWNNAGR